MAGNTELLTGAQIVLRALADQGVETIFGYPGGAVLPLYDALYQTEGLDHVLVRHEQGAIHAAEGYARFYRQSRRAVGNIGTGRYQYGDGAYRCVA